MKCVLKMFEWCTRSSDINQGPVFAVGAKPGEGLEVFSKQPSHQMALAWQVNILINLLGIKIFYYAWH